MNKREFGRYTLVKKLAAGGMAEVFLARQTGLEGFEKLLVLKRILPHLADDAEFVQMFLNEARIAARFNHPNICQIYDLGKIDETYFIAMEFVHGEDMGRVMRKCWAQGHWIPQPLALLIVARVCEALYYAHSKADENGQPLKVIHRDISPQNILVSFDGAVKLVDFGIARAADSRSNTRSGALKGKFAYMAPEQAAGKPIDHRADLFATGLVLYEFLTGIRPFKRDNDIGTLQAVMECAITPPSQAAPEVPPALDAVTMKALARVADDRYPDGRAFQMAIEEFLVREQWAASSVHLSEFMKTVFADRLAQEAQLGRPDPSTAESGSGSAVPPVSMPMNVDSGMIVAHSASDLHEVPSSPTMKALDSEPGGPSAFDKAREPPPPASPPSSKRLPPVRPSPTPAPQAALGGTSMDEIPDEEEEPTAGLPETPPRRTSRTPTGANYASPGTPPPMPAANPTRVGRGSGEVPRTRSSSEERAVPPPASAEPERRSPAAIASAETNIGPIPIGNAATTVGRLPDNDADLDLDDSTEAEPPAPVESQRKPRPTPARATRRATGGGSSRSQAALKKVDELETIPPPRKTTGQQKKRSSSAIAPVIDDQPSLSASSGVSGRVAWRPDKRAIAFAILLAGGGLGVLLFSPQIAAYLQKSSSTAVIADPGFLTVTTDPPGLDVLVNDRPFGKTPLVRAKIASNETLSIRIESETRGVNWTQTRRASPGEEVKMNPSFSIGRVIVKLNERRAARIFIGEKFVGQCDGLDFKCAMVEHPAGTYRLRLEDDSSGELMRGEVEVRIQSGRTIETAPVKLKVVKEPPAPQ